MDKNFNFSAGPAMLAREVLIQAQAELLDWHGSGVSVMEVSHRGHDFMQRVAAQSEADLRELMAIPSNYHVLFLSGGASSQFAMVPCNLLTTNRKADYVDTGIWSRKAIAEAKRYGDIHVAAELFFQDGLVAIMPEEEWSLRHDAAYVHYTPNETIAGIEFQSIPHTGSIPLVADMSSVILSQVIDVSAYGIIYAGAQKNLGQAGISVVIIRDDLAKECLPYTPTLYRYTTHIQEKSLYSTPPTFAWYMLGLTLAWMKKKGGVTHFEKCNARKSKKCYDAIDRSGGFYRNSVHPSARSRMNVCFDLPTDALTALFLDQSKEAGLWYLKGHKAAGGIRASIYNAMPEAGVDALIDFMKDFRVRYG